MFIYYFGNFKWEKELRNFGRDESRTSRRESTKIEIKLVTTCNKNEQQQDAKSIAKL
jgi:hypothetical protein